MNEMKIKFFENDGHINPNAIYAGVYQFKIGLLGDDEGQYLSLYVGESYSMLLRCSKHLYEVFYTDPSYFGLTDDNLKNEKLQLVVDIHKRVLLPNDISNSDRDILLRAEELSAIIELKPLSQNPNNDNLKKDRVKVVQNAINMLLSNR